jgi:anti-anti-sigma regulatory factor
MLGKQLVNSPDEVGPYRQHVRVPVEPTLSAHIVGDDEHAILVLTGHVQPGCDAMLRAALLESEKRDHGHVVVDVRDVSGMSREAVKTLLWELGRAFEQDRTLRLVVRDLHQKHFLDDLGLAGMLPTHATLDEAIAAAARHRTIDLTAREERAGSATRRRQSGRE